MGAAAALRTVGEMKSDGFEGFFRAVEDCIWLCV